MNIAVGSDHAGWALKNVIVEHLRKRGHTVTEVFPPAYDPLDDYPDAAAAVGRAIVAGSAERGLILCGSGVGACVAANKIRGVRAGLSHDTYSAHQGVEHDDVNVLCLGARIIGEAPALEIVDAFLAARFSGEARHVRRLEKVKAIEAAGR